MLSPTQPDSMTSPTPTETPMTLSARESEAFEQLAAELLQHGEVKLAIDYCRRAIQVQPTGRSYKLLGDGLQRLGRLAESENAYQHALKLEPDWAELYVNLGSLYAQQQQWLNALRCYRQTIRLKPELIEAQRNLERLWSQVSQSEADVEVLYDAIVAQPDQVTAQDHSDLGHVLLQQGQTQRAIICYRHALQLDPNFVEARRQLKNLAQSSLADEKPKVAVQKRSRASQPNSAQPRSAADFLSLGNSNAQQQQWDEALSAYRQAIALDPSLARAHWQLAKVLERSGQRNAAVESYFQALSLQSDLANPTELCRLGELLVQQEQYEQALTCYKWALQQDETLAEAHFQVGEVFARQERYEAAVVSYRKAIELQAGWRSYHSLGDALIKLQQWEAAATAYRQAIGLNPEFFWSHNNLGGALLKLKQWESAVDAYRRAIELNPEFFWSHNSLGGALLQLKQWEAAVPVYQAAVRLQPESAEAYQGLAVAQEHAGLVNEAIESFRRTLALNPNSPSWIYTSLASLLVQKGRFDQAVNACCTGLTVYPAEARLFVKLSEVQEAAGDVAGQVSSYQQLIATNADQDVSVYIALAHGLFKLGRYEEAVETYRQAAAKRPDFWLIYYYIGEIFYRQNQWAAAVNPFKQAIQLHPNFFYSQLYLGDCLAHLGRTEEATVAYCKAVSLSPDPTVVTKLTALLAPAPSEPAQGSPQASQTSVFPELSDENFIKRVFTDLLGRNPGDSEVALFLKHFSEDKLTRSSTLEVILKSDEFHTRIQGRTKVFPELDDRQFVDYVYTTFLHRTPDERGLAANLNALASGAPRARILENVLKSEEFRSKAGKPAQPAQAAPAPVEKIFFEKDDREFVEYVYATFLRRQADPQGLAANVEALANGASRSRILEGILKSQEFAMVNNPKVLEEFTDYEFLHTVWQILLGRVCDVNSERQWLKLFDSGVSRASFVTGLIQSNEFKQKASNFGLSDQPTGHSATTAWIMGTDKFITQEEWNDILLKVMIEEQRGDEPSSYISPTAPNPDALAKFAQVKHRPLVSIITSLYKGMDYIEHFMRNITSQTIFADFCELIIIDANSPEGEYEVIEPYMQTFKNIRYIRTEEVIGIYNAWNLGVENAKGLFLTNANLDDLRSSDCLEKQALALIENEDCDLVYQDVYYTFTPNLPFELIAKCGIKSNLPIATRANMLQFNSPHNAPMWRKSLHDRIGLFNTSYRSAGDYEMWLRALLYGSKFFKIQEALAVYYNNPFGLSTRSETKGVREAQDIQRVYIRMFGNNFLSMAKQDFIHFCAVNFGLHEKWLKAESEKPWQDKDTFLYRGFRRRLKEMSQNKFYIPLAN